MTFDRQAWLQERHAAWVSPDDVIADAIRSATGRSIADRERIIAGEVNETYRVTTAGGEQVVLKIAHGAPDRFERLPWVASSCSAVGVLVPEVLHTDIIELDDGPAGVAVQRYLPGEPMLHHEATLGRERVRDLTIQAGEVLARIHGVVAPEDEQAGVAAEMLDQHERVQAALTTDHPSAVDAATLADVDRIVRAEIDVLDRWGRRLTHGDFGPDHLILDGEMIGVIDLDNAGWGSPIRDLVWWDQWFDQEPRSSATLFDGYVRVRDPGDTSRARLVFGLIEAESTLLYNLNVDNSGGRDMMERRLAALLHAAG